MTMIAAALDAQTRQEMARHKRELAHWQRANRANIDLFKERVESYNRTVRLHKTQTQIIQNRYQESVRQINIAYEKLTTRAITPVDRRELDIERRAHLGDAIIIRDMALQELGSLPDFPEFTPLEGRPKMPPSLAERQSEQERRHEDEVA